MKCVMATEHKLFLHKRDSYRPLKAINSPYQGKGLTIYFAPILTHLYK